jgi:hypothetical protein
MFVRTRAGLATGMETALQPAMKNGGSDREIGCFDAFHPFDVLG